VGDEAGDDEKEDQYHRHSTSRRAKLGSVRWREEMSRSSVRRGHCVSGGSWGSLPGAQAGTRTGTGPGPAPGRIPTIDRPANPPSTPPSETDLMRVRGRSGPNRVDGLPRDTGRAVTSRPTDLVEEDEHRLRAPIGASRACPVRPILHAINGPGGFGASGRTQGTNHAVTNTGFWSGSH
jgi:hypothetical protein